MDSKVVFGFFRTGVKDLSTSIKYMDSKVDFWFYSYWGVGQMCRSTMHRGGGGGDQMCGSTMCRNLYKLTKNVNDVLSKYLKNGLGDLHETL